MHNKGFLHHQIWRNELYEVQEICLNLTHPDVFTYIKSFSRLHGHLIAWKLVILNALTLQAYSSEAELSTRPKKIFKNDEHQFFDDGGSFCRRVDCSCGLVGCVVYFYGPTSKRTTLDATEDFNKFFMDLFLCGLIQVLM